MATKKVTKVEVNQLYLLALEAIAEDYAELAEGGERGAIDIFKNAPKLLKEFRRYGTNP
jgi:hypothetical protein